MNDAIKSVEVFTDRNTGRITAAYRTERDYYRLTVTTKVAEAMWTAEQFRAEHGVESPVQYYTSTH